MHQAQGTRHKENGKDKKVQEERFVTQPGQQSLMEGGRWKILVTQSSVCPPCPPTSKRLKDEK